MVPTEFQNKLISALSESACEKFRSISRPVSFAAGEKFETTSDDLYFIEKGVVSIVNDHPQKKLAEVMSFGSESFIGLASLYTDLPSQPMVCLVTVTARVVTKKDFLMLIGNFPELRKICDTAFGKYIDSLLCLSKCLRNHGAEERLVTSILTTYDRCGEPFFLTQERLAQHLDISRTLVNKAATRLAMQGHLKYSRGYISVLDRDALTRLSCRCYSKPNV